MTLTDSQFQVKKEMPETQSGGEILSEYADAAFFYEAFVKVGEADYQPVTRQYLNSLNILEDKTPRYQDGTPVEWKTDNITETKFVVRPGQTAVFPAVDDSVQWYVKEVEPDGEPNPSRMLDDYMVSNSDQDINDSSGRTSKKDQIKNRSIVTYRNRPSDDLVNELRIIKKVSGMPYAADNKFEYRILLENTNGNMVPYSEGPYYQLDKDGKYVYFENGVRKTQTMPRVAEKTSVNGSVNNILDGDTIIIKGLLEGTDFYVYERTDSSNGNIAADGTPVENKYVFEGTEMTGAFDRRTDNPETYDFGHATGHLFETPSGLTGENGMITTYHITEYEQGLASNGSILKGSDADVTVKNKPYHPINIEVKKNWPEDTDDFHMGTDLNNAELTFTLQRYKLDTRSGTVNLTGILDNPPSTGADPVYHFIKDGKTIKTIAYSDLVKDAGNHNRGTLEVTDLPIGEYTIWSDDYVVGYTITHNADPADTITVTEGEETDVAITTNYTRQYGQLTIRKTLTGNYAAHPNDRFIYTVHGPDGVSFTAEKKVSDAVNGVINIEVKQDDEVDLPSGNFIITEEVFNGDTSGSGLSGKHTPANQSVYVNSSQHAYADFTGDYAAPLIPVTIHVGHTDYNGFYQDKTSVYYLPPGQTVTVTMSVKECQYYSEGVYAYGSTNACADGTIDAYKNGSTNPTDAKWVTRTFTFTVPTNVQTYDYYVKTKCDQASWDPTLISAIAQNSRSRAMLHSVRGGKLLTGAASKGEDDTKTYYNSVTDAKLPTLTPEQQAKSKFVIDGEWVMTVVMTKDGYSVYSGTDTTATPVDTGDITTGSSFWDAVLSHESILSEDENGNPYYYYIASFSEDGVPKGMTPSFDMDPNNSGKTLMSWKDNPQVLSVTNELKKTGALNLVKIVHVNDQTPTAAADKALVQGSYEFTVASDALDSPRSIVVTFDENGQASAVSGTGATLNNGVVTIADLPEGSYTITEAAPANGTSLSDVTVSPAQSGTVTNKVATLNVTAGNDTSIPMATFINNITQATIRIIKVEKGYTDGSHTLSGASFKLTRVNANNNNDDQSADAYQSGVLPVDNQTGELTFTGLKAGRYRLEEKKVPDGYVSTEGPWYFTVTSNGEASLEATYQMASPSGTTNEFYIQNEPGAELPYTGGSGTRMFTILGSVLLAFAGIVLIRRRRII